MIRELVVNAIVHRDYYVPDTDVFVKIYSDRIEISNPASFPLNSMSFEEIKEQGLSVRRNPVIASFFEKTHDMEQDAQGFKRIFRYCKDHGLPSPVVTATENVFRVVVYNSRQNVDTALASPFAATRDFSGLNDRQIRVLDHMRKKGPNFSISRSDYIALCDIHKPRLATHELRQLVHKGYLQQVGKKRGTRYYLLPGKMADSMDRS